MSPFRPAPNRTGSAAAKPCNLCGNVESDILFSKFGFDIVACRSCGLQYLPWLLTPADLKTFYNDGYFTGQEDRAGYLDYGNDEANLLGNFDGKLQDMETLQPPGRLLDVGAALGFSVLAASRRGWQATGLEVSEYAAGEARRRGLDVVCGPSLDVFAADQFDAVTMWDVIEHLNDPRGSLQQVYRVLKPGGLVVLSTGDVGHFVTRILGRHNRMYCPPQHLFYFTRQTMRAMLEACGFEVVRTGPDVKSVQLHYILHIIQNLADNRLLEATGRLARRLIPNRTLRLTLWDVMVMSARKPRHG